MNVRILSYNIHRAIGVDRRFRPDRIARVIAHHDPDVALLQEVDEGVPRSRELDLARELAERLGYPHLAVGHNVSLRRGRYGNATLSRFPIARERNIDLSIRTRKRRGCQHTRIELGPGFALEAFNLHFGLSAQERRVMALYGAGQPVKAVAFQLGISEETAKSYLKRIREKYRVAGFDVGTKVALRKRAILDGILLQSD